MSVRTLALAAVLSVFALAGPALAMSNSDEVKLEDVEKLIAAEDYRGAVMKLDEYTMASPWDADGFNLLGYSKRQLGAYDEAKEAYDRALRLDPEHRGAMEYLGELYLKTGQSQEAEKLLQQLETICGTDCAEYRELAKAIADRR